MSAWSNVGSDSQPLVVKSSTLVTRVCARRCVSCAGPLAKLLTLLSQPHSATASCTAKAR